MTEYDRGRAAGLAEAVEVLNAYREYDKPMCCDGRECGCQGASVFDTIEHYIRALSTSPGEHVLVPRDKLQKLADQKTSSELDDEGVEDCDCDWRGAYDEMVEAARAMLSAEKE